MLLLVLEQMFVHLDNTTREIWAISAKVSQSNNKCSFLNYGKKVKQVENNSPKQIIWKFLQKTQIGDAWVLQLVKCPTSAQVMILQFMGLSSTSNSLLSAQSLLQILCPPLFLPLPHSFSLTQKKKKKKKEGLKKRKEKKAQTGLCLLASVVHTYTNNQVLFVKATKM